MTVTSIFLAALLAAEPGGLKLDKDAEGVVYSKHLAFRIPLNLSPEDRQGCKAIRLFVSQDHGETWVRHSDGSPDMKLVTFRAFKDGTYWFTLAVVDADDVQEPADVGAVDPGLKVVVDSTTPELVLNPIRNTAGKRGVRWELDDANLDPLSLRIAVCRQPGDDWTLETVRHPERMMLWFDDDWDVQKVQAMVRDRAGNQTVQQVEIHGDRFARKSPEAFAIPETETHVAQRLDEPASPVRRVSHSSPISGREPMETSEDEAEPEPSVAEPPRFQSLTKRQSEITDTAARTEAAEPTPPGASDRNAPSDRSASQPAVCKTDTVVVNYQLDVELTDAVVELWGTQDDGKRWTLLAVDRDGRSPVEAKLTSDGVWGLLVRVPETPAEGGVPPALGTQPDTYIELDTKAPQVTVEPASIDGNDVTIRWRASDRNLGERPVTISYSNSAAGPWKPIAEHIENSGSYEWTLKETVHSMHYFRVEVADQAGNVSRGVTRASVRPAKDEG